MALVTLQRSPTPSAASTASTTTTNAGEDFGSDDERRLNQSLSESFFMVKGAALFLQQGSGPQGQRAHPYHKHAGDLPQHLQVMINILRSEDRIKLAVRLESAWSDRLRYMVVVYTGGCQDTEENILLGMDFTNKDSKSCSIGMVLPLWSDTKIHLDGDGGFSVNTVGRSHVFKPVSVQAMWSALQILHKACEVSRRYNYFPGGMALTWTGFYESCVSSEQSCINEWNAMRDLETARPDSPTMFLDKPSERERTECLIKAKLRSIMMCQDLENVTSKEIRSELEHHMSCNLNEYKEFIDNEMLLILGQMDKPTLIFDHLYLGSEWNASNLEELQDTGVGYILNVTREIDNFFPGTFSYHNIRVYDEEATDLLAHWNETYNFIVKAKKSRSKCLVHCKMGVSRSASTVIAYAMKEYGWSLEKAYSFVKQKRSITRPNAGFMRQLAEYEGILDASKQRHNKLWRPDCDLTDDQAGAPCCGGEEAGPPTPEPGMSPCCDEALSDKASSRLSPPCRAVSLAVDPAYNNYYFRRLSDSALDSEPSTPVRGPPLLDVDRVFIEIEDVERDALLDDEAFEGREGPPLPHFGASGEGTAAQTCTRGPEPLEELRLRLEFSTVEEEDEEEVQKEEAEMEALMQPGGGGGGEGDGEEEMVQDVEEEGDKESNEMDMATLNRLGNENSNNNNNSRMHPFLNFTPAAAVKPAPAVQPSAPSRAHSKPRTAGVPLAPGPAAPPCRGPGSHPCVYLETSRAKLPFSPTPPPTLPLPSTAPPTLPLPSTAPPTLPLPSTSPDSACCTARTPWDPLCDNANSAAVLSQAPADVCRDSPLTEPLPVPEYQRLVPEEERPAPACIPAQQTPLLEGQRSGLVRRTAQRLERLSGASQDGPQPLDPHPATWEPPSGGEEAPASSASPRGPFPEPLASPVRLDPLLAPSGAQTPASSPHGAALTRSSSSDSLRSVRGTPGLVRQRAQEIEMRMRLAGLTLPSRLKRSNSLAKLGSLTFSSEDLCSICSLDGGGGLLMLSPEPEAPSPDWPSPLQGPPSATSGPLRSPPRS
ncbi:protein phosphatase Slingshot homolog 1 isoform X1 [Osmerus eperlanus]|uniref:protein phosphatase Slingshot homolog 1 isoform X1 n=1 Tax=Osmerus eperlanus TaxID=29151 RepID=UPI002E10634C